MLKKHIIPAGLVVCIGIFIFAVQSGLEQTKTSSLPLNLVSQTYNEVANIVETDPQAASQLAPTPSEPEDDAKYLPCTKADFDRADGLYDPIKEYEFGLKIQRAVESEDVQSLFDLVYIELAYGPRKAFAKKTPFNELFGSDFKDSVLKDTPNCYGPSSRGNSIGNGDIWYNLYSDGSHYIFSIPSAQQETIAGIASVGWPYEGSVLPSSCFSTEWHSSDNYEEYAEQFSITDFYDFTANMGQYFGREITNLKPIPAWDDTISLVRSLSSCATPLNPQAIRDGYVWSDDTYNYRVIGEIDTSACNELASSLNNTCSKAFLVQHNSFGGSIGVIRDFYAYGLFDLPELGPSIVPLKNLYTLNKSLNWLDDQKKVLACNDFSNIKKNETLISITGSDAKFKKVEMYCDEDWAVGASVRHQYLELLDESGNSTGVKIGSGFGDSGEDVASPALKYPNQIDMLSTPSEFPLLAVSVFNYSASNISTQVLLLDPEDNYTTVEVIDNPLNKYQSSKFEGVGSGPENELEGIYEEQGEFYINTLDLISYDDRKYAVIKNLIRRSPPYLSRVSAALFSDPQQECLVDGKTITINGTIELETFAGPPNYSSIEDGDKELNYWILTSDKEYQCGYRRSFESGKLVTLDGVYNRFQIVDQYGQLSELMKTQGSNVSITGELMAGHTGYHNTDFLLIVKSYE